MEKHLLKILLGLSVMTSIGCGHSTAGEETKIGVEESSTWGSVSQKPNGEYSGTGGFRFLKTLSSAQVSLGMDLGGYLDEENSSIELVMFAKNPNLIDGVHLKLFRASGNTLMGTVEVNNTGAKTISTSRLNSFLPSPVDMVVDFHAQGSSVRIMIYQGGAPLGAPYFFDSRRAGDLVEGSLGNSSLNDGIHGGILMTNARVSKAQRREPITSRDSALK